MQVAIGVPPAIIRRAQAMTAVLPYAIGVVCATALSLLAAAGFDHITDIRGVPVSRAALLSTGIVALGGALVVGLSVLPSIGRPLTPDLLRQE